MTGTCFECGSVGPLHQHHVVPRSLGGTRTIPLCVPCHRAVHSPAAPLAIGALAHRPLTDDARLIRSWQIATKKLPGEVPTPGEVTRLIRACGRSASGIRNAALVATMFGTGLRVSEALALRPSDLDLAAGTVRVRDIPLPVAPATSAPLARWLDLRAGLGLNGRQPLFCTISAGEVREKGQPLSSSYVRALLPRLAARAGIDRRVHPNALRHSHAFYVTAEAVKVAQR